MTFPARPAVLGCFAALVLLLGACQRAPPTGALEVDVAGLPATVEAAVSVTGPGDFQDEITGDRVLTGLAPGSYAVRADAIAADGSYVPDVVQQSVVVSAGRTSVVGVNYSKSPTGGLQVTVSGLPEGAEAEVTITGPQGFEAIASGSTTLDDLAPGEYLVSAADVSVEGEDFSPSRSAQPAEVTANQTAAVTVEYLPRDAGLGSLTVSVEGLGAGAEAAVSVTGPEGFTETVTATTTFNGLLAGDYTLTAEDASSSLHTYSAEPASQQVSVVAGGAASATVTYTAITGAIQFVVNGLPGGVPAGIDLEGPNGYSHTIDESAVLPYLEPGAYSFPEPEDVATADDVTGGAIGFTYAARDASFDGQVSPGETALAEVLFEAVTGSVRVEITGLPRETQVVATLAGHALKGSATINNLSAGTYELSAFGIVVDGFTYHQDVFQTDIQVAAGKVAATSIEYRPVDGKLDLTIESGVEPEVVVSGPGIGTVPVIQSTLFTKLDPGSYDIVARTISTGKFGEPSCRIHTPSPANQSKQVTAGDLTAARVTYVTTSCAPKPSP